MVRDLFSRFLSLNNQLTRLGGTLTYRNTHRGTNDVLWRPENIVDGVPFVSAL